jgi:NhaP-type Na+/H+ or K+/H+ antiporter
LRKSIAIYGILGIVLTGLAAGLITPVFLRWLLSEFSENSLVFATSAVESAYLSGASVISGIVGGYLIGKYLHMKEIFDED